MSAVQRKLRPIFAIGSLLGERSGFFEGGVPQLVGAIIPDYEPREFELVADGDLMKLLLRASLAETVARELRASGQHTLAIEDMTDVEVLAARQPGSRLIMFGAELLFVKTLAKNAPEHLSVFQPPGRPTSQL